MVKIKSSNDATFPEISWFPGCACACRIPLSPCTLHSAGMMHALPPAHARLTQSADATAAALPGPPLPDMLQHPIFSCFDSREVALWQSLD